MRFAVLPVMIVLTVISGAVGLQLGESAIGQIDPLYFQGPAPAVVGITSSSGPAPQAAYAQASGWAEGYAARAQDCENCGAGGAAQAVYRREPLPDVSPALTPPRRTEVAEAELAVEELPQRSAESERVRRYVDYPVSADQTRIRAALEGREDKPEPEGF